MEEILLENVIFCSGCHPDEHENGACRSPNDPVMKIVFGHSNCMCGQRLTGPGHREVKSVPTGGRIGSFPTIRGDRR